MPKVILTKTLLQKSWSTRPILFFKYALRWFQLFPKRYIGSKNYFRILHQAKLLSVTNISVDSRTAAAGHVDAVFVFNVVCSVRSRTDTAICNWNGLYCKQNNQRLREFGGWNVLWCRNLLVLCKGMDKDQNFFLNLIDFLPEKTK